MAKLTVYAFTLSWKNASAVVHVPFKATRTVIEFMPGATIIETSKEEVDAEKVDPSGRYYPSS